jgi:hypothetical protein
MMHRIGISAVEPLCRNAINDKIDAGGQTNSVVMQ